MRLFLMAFLIGILVWGQEYPTVGMEGKIKVLLPGFDWIAKPVSQKSAVVVRIANKKKKNSQCEYWLCYIGEIPGKYNLNKHLLDKYGRNKKIHKDIFVRVLPLLPQKHNGILENMPLSPVPVLGSYSRIVTTLTVFWLLLFVCVIFANRSKKEKVPEHSYEKLSLAERVLKILQEACVKTASIQKKREIENLLTHYWRKQLGLENLKMQESIAKIRSHKTQGVFFQDLEDCLHNPKSNVELVSILKKIQSSLE